MEITTLVDADKLLLQYELPANLKSAEKAIEGLNAFIDYFMLEEYVFRSDAVDVNISRIYYSTLKSGNEITEKIINELLSGEQTVDTPEMQRILNLGKAIQAAEIVSEKKLSLSVDNLQLIHKQLSARMPNSHCSGLLRTKSNLLLTHIENDRELPEGSILNKLLSQTMKIANDKRIPLIIRSWLLYYSLMSIQPFYDENETVATIACSQLLEQGGLGFFGLLNFEKHVFNNTYSPLSVVEQFQEKNYVDRLDSDITGFLASCLDGFINNLKDIKLSLAKQARAMLNYDKLNARQKNNMNFWLEQGFYKNYSKLKDLSERQNEILMLLTRYVSLSTKDLVPIFRVDRKTIQRDFTELMEKGIVESRGSGRNLRYFLDFRTYC